MTNAVYPFGIYFEKEVFAVLNAFSQQGYERTLIHFWYPRVHCWGDFNLDFIQRSPSYPETSAPWDKSLSDDSWDEIPF